MRMIKKGSTDRSAYVRIIDATTGAPETAVEHDTAGIDLWYRREGATKTSITEAALASLDAAHSDGGIEHIGDGYYRLDLPDAAWATGANEVAVGGTVTGMIVIGEIIRLVNFDPEDGVRAGLTALPNAAAEASGGLFTRGTGAGQINQAANGQIDANAVAISGDTGAADNLESACDGGTYNVGGGAVVAASVTGAVGSVTGAVGSVTGAVGSVTAGVTLADGAHGGASASLALGAGATISNAAGSALTLTSSGGNGHGLIATGNGTGEGITAQGGATGHGIAALAGGSSGSGIVATGNSSGCGIIATAGPTGDGIRATGGASSGDGIHASATDGDGIDASGGTAGHGILATGGATGSGIHALGGATSGDGLHAEAQTDGDGIHARGADNGNGINADGDGSGDGISAAGGATGSGIDAYGGVTSGSGLVARSVGSNSAGLQCIGHGSEPGVQATGGETGAGIRATGGSTSGDGIYAYAQGNNDAGMKLAAHGAGDDLEATITASVSAAAIADAVWDEPKADHTTNTTFGDLATDLNTVVGYGAPPAASVVADAVWDETSTGHTDAGKAGAQLFTDIDAILADTGTDGVALSSSTMNSIAAALLDLSNGIETGYTLRQVMRIVAAAVAGKLSGGATTTNTFRDITDAKTRITATVDADGNRSAITLDGD